MTFIFFSLSLALLFVFSVCPYIIFRYNKISSSPEDKGLLRRSCFLDQRFFSSRAYGRQSGEGFVKSADPRPLPRRRSDFVLLTSASRGIDIPVHARPRREHDLASLPESESVREKQRAEREREGEGERGMRERVH